MVTVPQAEDALDARFATRNESLVRWRAEPLPAGDVFAAWQAAMRRRGSRGCPGRTALYVHFPYCQPPCRYCQYWRVALPAGAGLSPYLAYLEALLRRFGQRFGALNVDSAYFGGGTPSLASAAQLRRVLTVFGWYFRVRGEFTVEGNPTSLDAEKLAVLAAGAVNRVSLGVQSFDAGVLATIGRAGASPTTVAALVREARRHRLFVNLDLVLGLPGQSAHAFSDDVHGALAARPDTVTVYGYQPTSAMGAAHAPTLDYVTGLTPALRAGIARARYDIDWPTSAHAFRARLVRRGLPPPPPDFGYSSFDVKEQHLLGFGTGSLSHLYGWGWYREVTPLTSIGESSDPLFWGTRVDLRDEVREHMRAALSAGEGVDVEAWRLRTGIDLSAFFAEPAACGPAEPRWLRRGHEVFLNPEASAAARVAVLRALLPDAERPGLTPLDVCESWAAALPEPRHPDVTEGLLVRRSRARLAEIRRGQARLEGWRRLLGIPDAGHAFASARVLASAGAEIAFQVEPEPRPPLRLTVGPAATTDAAFFRSRHYAVGFCDRTNASLGPREVHFLRQLCERLAHLDP